MYVIPVAQHNEIISKVYEARGYPTDEAQIAARVCAHASWHGIRTHNGIKALHLEHVFGSHKGGCVPGAKIEKLPSKFAAVEKWNANYKLGQVIATEAIEACIKMADKYGSGTVVVDNAFHYLWGGGYVIDAANRGYIAYTCCNSALAEVVPYGGRFPTLGTNPHSWAFPTQEAVGFPICVDWATSKIAMGKVQQLLREGKELPPGSAVDKEGKETRDPKEVFGLLPFGEHKGYGAGLVDELYSAFIGSSTPTLRGRFGTAPKGEKQGVSFLFQVIHPESIGCDFAFGRTQMENVKHCLADIVGHGNEGAMLPGQLEADAAKLSEKHGGLLFTQIEIDALLELAKEGGSSFDPVELKQV